MNDLIPIPKEKIDEIFNYHNENKSHQSQVLFSLYEIPIPDIKSENVESIHNWPKVNRETNEYIMSKFISYDVKIHPSFQAGGLWMNNGFSDLCEEKLDSWVISMKDCKVVRKENI